MENKEKENAIETLSQVLQWTCSPRGGSNFYGRVLNGCGRTVNRDIPTAAVTITREGKYMFMWDPEWFAKQSMAFRILVVIHEAGHIVLQHLERILRYRIITKNDERFNRLVPLLQIAADMATNDIAIRPFIETATFRDHKGTLIFPEHEQFQFPTGESFDQYFERLLKKSQDEGYDPVTGKGDAPAWIQQITDWLSPKHIPWWDMVADMTDAEVERIVERAKREAKGIVKKAAEQTIKSRGTIPGHLQHIIDELLKEPTIPWDAMLHGMLKTAISSKLEESIAWPNTAMLTPEAMAQGLEPYPGFQKDFEFHMAVAIDTSGSVSDSDFIKFLSEIQGIQNTNKTVSIQILHYDAAIQKEYLLKDDDKIENHIYRHGYGGTDFTPPLKRFLGQDEESDWEPDAERIQQGIPTPDLVVMFTDGYAPVSDANGGPMPEFQPPCPLMWVLTEDGNHDEAMGDRVVKINTVGD